MFTQEQWIERFRSVHQDKYDYSRVKFVNSGTKIEIVCPEHGPWWSAPTTHYVGHGCARCAIEKSKHTTEDFIIRANIIHNNKYDYSQVKYVLGSEKVSIICPDHGIFLQNPSGHLRGQGCIACSSKKSLANLQPKLIFNTQEFIEKAILIHKDRYTYSKVEYKSYNDKIIITCKDHGDFLQNPNAHLRGRGCKECQINNIRSNISAFIKASNIMHNNFYDYSKSIYTVAHALITIICPIHKEFEQEANNHLRGHGCAKCIGIISKKETKWLDMLNIPNNKNCRQVKILGKKVDGYDPITNTIYEFYGDFWHGNLEKFRAEDENPISKKTYGQLYEITMKREMILKAAGYKIISIWESDFKKLLKLFKLRSPASS